MHECLLDPEFLKGVSDKYQKTHKHPIQYGVVIYTDGGCRLKYPLENEIVNLASYGVHGYIYALESTKTGAGIAGYKVTTTGYELKDDPIVDIRQPESWADYFTADYLKQYKTHETRSAIDIVNPQVETCVAPNTVVPLYYFNIMGGLRDATNQVGEMVGFIKAFELVARIQAEIPLAHVHLKSDSKYVLQRVQLRYQDLENDWRSASTGAPLANVEHLKELSATLATTIKKGTNYTCEWIKGHQDAYGNIQADGLASKALVGACNGVFTEHLTVAPAKGYWGSLKKPSTTTQPEHYLLVDQLWYYNTQTEDCQTEDGQWGLCLGTHLVIGQPNSEYGMCVVLLNERPEAFTRLIDMSKRLDRVENGLETHGVFTVPVNDVLKPVLNEDIVKYGADYLKMSREPKVIKSLAKKEVLTRIDPPECALDQMYRFDNILDVLTRVKSGELFQHEVLNDVTDQIYVTREQGKKTKTELAIGNDAGFPLDVVVRTYDHNHVYRDLTYSVMLTHGITTPKKRVFSGLKDYNVRIYILTSFEAFTGFRYYTVIKLDTGEWGIWTNPHANLRNI